MTKHRAVGGVENMWVLKTHLLVTWRLITDSSLFTMSFTKCWMSTYCVSLTIQPDSSFYFDCWLLFKPQPPFPCDSTSGRKTCAYTSSFATGGKFSQLPAQGIFAPHHPEPQPLRWKPNLLPLSQASLDLSNKISLKFSWCVECHQLWCLSQIWVGIPVTSAGYYRTLLTRLWIEIASQVGVPNPKSLQTSWEDGRRLTGITIKAMTDVSVRCCGSIEERYQ